MATNATEEHLHLAEHLALRPKEAEAVPSEKIPGAATQRGPGKREAGFGAVGGAGGG